jgi:hypothetical protein
MLSKRLRGFKQEEAHSVELAKDAGKKFLDILVHTMVMCKREVNVEKLLATEPARVEKDLVYSAGYNKALQDIIDLINTGQPMEDIKHD